MIVVVCDLKLGFARRFMKKGVIDYEQMHV